MPRVLVEELEDCLRREGPREFAGGGGGAFASDGGFGAGGGRSIPSGSSRRALRGPELLWTLLFFYKTAVRPLRGDARIGDGSAPRGSYWELTWSGN